VIRNPNGIGWLCIFGYCFSNGTSTDYQVVVPSISPCTITCY
jgi:hypothetical protein